VRGKQLMQLESENLPCLLPTGPSDQRDSDNLPILAYSPDAAGRARPPAVAEALAGRSGFARPPEPWQRRLGAPSRTDGRAIRPYPRANTRDPTGPFLHLQLRT
jgi:hypothetical protein